MNKYVTLILAVLLSVAVIFMLLKRGHKNWLVDSYIKKDVYITMRDGVRLYTIIYIPKDKKTKHPIIINRTPYSVESYGENSLKSFCYWNSLYTDFFKENYIIVRQDVRGRYMSEGVFADVRPFNPGKKGNETDEASDAYDTIDWLVKNIENNNGRVGALGISYPGFYAAMAAYCGHPALKAVSPQAPVSDWFLGDDWHHNGALMEMDAFNFYRFFGEPRRDTQRALKNTFQYHSKDGYKFFLDVGPIKNLRGLMDDSERFFKGMYDHPDYDRFWQQRNTGQYAQYIPGSVACMIVGGFFDAEDLCGALALYDSIEKKARCKNVLVMGPWMHGAWRFNDGDSLGSIRFGTKTSGWYQRNIELPFFNYYLKGEGNVDAIKKANIFFTGANEWKTFNEWPPKQSDARPLYLHPGGALGTDVPPAGAAGRKYTSDPANPVPYSAGISISHTAEYMDEDQRFAAVRPDVLVYQTDSLKEDLVLAGPVTADIFTSISTTDADFVVKLIDVFPADLSPHESAGRSGNSDIKQAGGYQMLVRAEVMRGRYRNSFSKPEPFIPFKSTEVKYVLPDVAHVFKKRHRIMVQVQSSWFPLADRNPQQFVDIYHCDTKDFVRSEITILSDREHPSALVLPVLSPQAFSSH